MNTLLFRANPTKSGDGKIARLTLPGCAGKRQRNANPTAESGATIHEGDGGFRSLYVAVPLPDGREVRLGLTGHAYIPNGADVAEVSLPIGQPDIKLGTGSATAQSGASDGPDDVVAMLAGAGDTTALAEYLAATRGNGRVSKAWQTVAASLVKAAQK